MGAGSLGAGVGRVLEALAFTSALVAAAAAALAAAAGAALGVGVGPDVLALAFAGTLAVYNLDRLRDLARDRATTPRRAGFVTAHRGALLGLALASGVAGVGLLAALLARAGPAPALVLAPAALLGLAHRRIKHLPLVKPLYISAAWLLVVVGLPAAAAPGGSGPGALAWVAAILACALLANAIASNVRDGEAGAALFGPRLPLQAARGLAALGVLLGAAAPAPPRSLLAVPLLTLAALAGFRASERYGLLVVDGALLAGALVALGLAPAGAGG